MKFSTRCDTDVSASVLFDGISDFARLERLLQRRRVQLRRIDPGQAWDIGAGWYLGFDWRGQRREMELRLAGLEPVEHVRLHGQSDSYETAIDMTVVALGHQRSRLIFATDIRPRNMRARLMLQTAKLGKGQLDQKYAERIGAFVQEALIAA